MKTDTLGNLSKKLCVLMLLVTGQRCQTLHVTKIQDISFDFQSKTLTITPSSLLKQSKPGKHLKPIILRTLDKTKNLCVVTILKEYLQRTKELRNTEFLVTTTVQPYKAASKSTISRWVKQTLRAAGVAENFKPHSTRAAASSKVNLTGVPLQDILDTAGWANAKTFAKYYNKHIEPEVTHSEKFQSAVLGNKT